MFSSVSNTLQFVHRPFILNIARVQRRGRLEQHDPTFFVCRGTMLYSARHYDKLALFDPFMAVAKIHAEAALHHQKHFVLVLMTVKYELAVELDELNLLSVEFGGDARLVVFGNLGELFGDVDFGHESSRFAGCYFFSRWRVTLVGRRKVS